jgi:hypothetical protein
MSISVFANRASYIKSRPEIEQQPLYLRISDRGFWRFANNLRNALSK